MQTEAARRKAHDAYMRELADWKAREAAAEAVCDATTDLEELADALRDYLLAKADHMECRYGRRDAETVALWRRRANSESYHHTMAVFRLAKRLMKAADEAHSFSPDERAARDQRYAAESAALNAAINAMLRSIR